MFPEGRLFDFLIVGAVALIVVGPKDLPLLLRKVGQFMAKVRGMAAEFRASFDELARQSELDELRREVRSLRSGQPIDMAARSIGAGDLVSDIRSGLADTNAAIAAHTAPVTDTPPAPVMTAIAPPDPPAPEAPSPPPKPKRVRKPKAPAAKDPAA